MARILEEPSPLSRDARNIHLYNNNGELLGGVFQNGSITCKNFYGMCPDFLKIPNTAPWEIFYVNTDGSTGQVLPHDDKPIERGLYVLLAPDQSPVSVSASLQSYPRRVPTNQKTGNLTPQRTHFRDTVRRRDRGCMISGIANPLADIGNYVPFQAAHIFPQAREPEWRQRDFDNLVTDTASEQYIGSTKIHSAQNGLLLRSDIHALFDDYAVAVNPDDAYKVTCFIPDVLGVDGRTLEVACRDPQDPLRVQDELLRWHFHTSILAKMRGQSELPWETDFADGDMMGEIVTEPDAAERMEVELATRLGVSI